MADLKIHKDELYESASDIGSESEDDFDNGSLEDASTNESRHADERASDEAAFQEKVRQTAAFKEEVRQTVERALKEGHAIEDARIEISNLRVSQNQNFAVIREACVPVLIDHIVSNLSKNSRREEYKRWGPLISKVTHDIKDKAHVLEIIQVPNRSPAR